MNGRRLFPAVHVPPHLEGAVSMSSIVRKVAIGQPSRSWHNRVLQYALDGVEARCECSALYIWVDD
jgi:hypothetical protein